MPLAFDSLSHGRIAFGFFNVDVDLLLLDRHFFFADEFCGHTASWASGYADEYPAVRWTVRLAERPGDVGDLHGAIQGFRLTGLIGDVYRRFPFPGHADGFKQDPDGRRNREAVAPLLDRWTRPVGITLWVDRGLEVGIGPYRFSRYGFHDLVRYVWQGGYPRWQGEIRPDYALEMKARVDSSRTALYRGFHWD